MGDAPYTQHEGLIGLTVDDPDYAQATTSALDDASRGPITVHHGKELTFSIEPIYYEGAMYEGNPTQVFAWVGLPTNEGLEPGSVPAVVLVHGGGGTAFYEWVAKWNERGYAAISMALEGQTDVRQPKEVALEEKFNYKRHTNDPGPLRRGRPYGDWQLPIEDQWMFQSVANAMRGHNLIRSYDYIDTDSVGVVGVSWGGVIATTVIGVDQRFAFAVSIYGCGDMHNGANFFGKGVRFNPDYPTVWDPVLGLSQTEVPVLFMSFPQEHTFPLPNWQASIDATASPTMQSLVFDMGHGHPAGWSRPESYAFAFWATHGRKHQWSEQIKEEINFGDDGEAEAQTRSLEPRNRQRRHRPTYEVHFRSFKTFDKAELIYATDELTSISTHREWQRKPASLTGDPATKEWIGIVALPPGTKSWFMNFHTKDHDLIVSSTYHEQDLEEEHED